MALRAFVSSYKNFNANFKSDIRWLQQYMLPYMRFGTSV